MLQFEALSHRYIHMYKIDQSQGNFCCVTIVARQKLPLTSAMILEIVLFSMNMQPCDFSTYVEQPLLLNLNN